jgi:hypothetical protein
MSYKTIVLSASKNGKTNQIATAIGIPVLYAEDMPIINSENIILVCANCGDEELPESMEKFLIQLKVKHKKYAICELGNYFGYEWTEFGAATIIRSELEKLNWTPILNALSIDTFPTIDWETFENWQRILKCKIGI